MTALAERTLQDVLNAADKGEYVSSTTIYDLTGKCEGDEGYAFALLHMKEQVERELKRRLGIHATVKIEQGGVRVLTDAEASEYNHKLVKKACGQILKAHRRNQDVDVSNLTQEERRDHADRLRVDGAFAQAVRETRKDLRVEPHKRQTPGLS